MTVIALDLETFMRLTAPPQKAVPCETFRWRDRAGNLHAPSAMATRHLFFTLCRAIVLRELGPSVAVPNEYQEELACLPTFKND